MFSSRSRWDREPNRLSVAIERARAAGQTLIDLTESNPTRCGLVNPRPLVAELGHPRGALYEPSALGHPVARAAVAAAYGGVPSAVNAPAADRVVLSASTSEAYGWLFKLLADPGDRVLVPRPSYPLLEWLAAAEGVTLERYPLVADDHYRIDFAALEAHIDAKTRAIVVVHPNNPTGHFVRTDDAERLVELARARRLALIIDEVFGDTAHGVLPRDRLASFAGTSKALTFVMSGASKLLLLPQCKIAWTLVSGPDELVREALARLELIADSYLSVSTPVQLALPHLLQRRAAITDSVRHRVTNNLALLDRVLASLGTEAPMRRLPVEAGWCATLEVPRIHDDEAWATLLVEREGVVVHPGYFFDFEAEGLLVVSLLPEPSLFAPAIERVLRAIAREAGS